MNKYQVEKNCAQLVHKRKLVDKTTSLLLLGLCHRDLIRGHIDHIIFISKDNCAQLDLPLLKKSAIFNSLEIYSFPNEETQSLQ